ncbi:hypothetical protein CDL12_20036 [Handroanthus impetiginosus]|uniref:Uncharacterized protein n=1 Tax=Handroanthus impetiginosus TaxID=429701 RepID=A0A2G9GQ28_9LAMI|nr:hypothetical protein CDL12_20036 [Handroanthus impetiginosus]
MPEKISPNVAVDFTSSESLSFSGLVCVQDQHLECRTEHFLSTTVQKEGPKVHIQGPEFEFSRSIIGNTSNKRSDDKTTISSYQHQVPKEISSEDFSSSIPGHKKRSDMKQSNIRSSSRKQVPEVKKRTNEKRPARRKGFSQELFSSFVKPCRDCRASEPTTCMKQQPLQ